MTKADAFRSLHVPGDPLLMPNPWDAGTAKILASLGFQALATTSDGHAATLGPGQDRRSAHSRRPRRPVPAVRAAHRGEAVLSPTVAGRLMGNLRQPPGETLSARELDVLRLVAGGATNKEAARRLFVSEATIKTHLLHIYGKLGVRGRAAAVAAGFERGLLVKGRAQ